MFASLKRAPDTLVGRIQAIPGVDQVQTRVVAAVRLEVPGFTDPVTGTLVSVPDTHPPRLNTLYLRQGRARRRHVEAGHRNGLVAEIIGGLRSGDRVITHPDDRIENGVRVQVHDIQG